MDDTVDQTPIDVDDDQRSDGESKDTPTAYETLAQVEPKPLQSWLIKIPSGLAARWKGITEAGIPLGKLRHYPPTATNPDRHFVLVVPEDPSAVLESAASSGSKPDVKTDVKPKEPAAASAAATPGELQYMLSDDPSSHNLGRQKLLYMEDRRRYEFNGTSKRKGHPRLVQAVSKQCNITQYRWTPEQQKRQLEMQYAHPEAQRKKTKLLISEQLTAGQRNSLATGNSLMQDKRKHGLKTSLAMPTGKSVNTRPQKERSYRMPKQNLIDTLFDDFASFKYWSTKALTDRHRQPEAWLKICLAEIAEADTEGPYKGLFRLKPQFAAGHAEAGKATAAPAEQEMTEDARRALTALGAEGDDDDEPSLKAENDTADDAELRELEGEEDDDMEEVQV
ncbi:hypothetical protein NliqN6_4819 [Naganishia liquefaciens]|uniref:Transcription initiation factor IIF subunit beta n=1 Tax=Naganishia liquefaciens TaxID=104408 RepID=A0A8H3TWG5_9TREE|nr:hypothetical protein NliqN6_4819 [Naganishia liquefaciens]